MTAPGQSIFQLIKGIEELAARPFVNVLPGGEARLVDAVVDLVVNKGTQFLLFRGNVFGEKIYLLVLRQRAKGIVKHLANIVLAIIDNASRLLVPEHRDGDAAIKFRFGQLVSFGEKVKTVDRVGRDKGLAGARPSIRTGIGIAKSPSASIAYWVHDRQTDYLLQPEQLTSNQRPARPWTSQ